MLLPSDNSIVLGDDNGALVVDRTDRPAPTREALAAFLPAWARALPSALRDAILDAAAAQANLAWARTGQTFAALRSPRDAAGPWLAAWGELLHRPRVGGEDEGAYRARLLAPPDVVTPLAIRAAVDALVAEVTVTPAVLLEPAVDCMFAAPVDSPWMCFGQPVDARLWGDDPGRPGAAWGAHAQPVTGASFWVIVPVATDQGEPLCYAEPAPGPDAGDSFAAPFDGAFAFVFAEDDTLLDRIVSSVEPRRGGGVAWLAFNDPLLVAAV